MLLVETYLAPSKIHGIGLFARHFIPRGTLISKFRPGFDLVIPKEELSSLSPPVIGQVEKYAYRSRITGDYILCGDDQRFTNHADVPNTVCLIDKVSTHPEDLDCYASRDISAGEEITNDYTEFDMDWSDSTALRTA